MKKTLSLIVALVMVLLVGAASADVTLRAAVGYSKEKTGITFDAETAGEGVTLADGVTYHTGDLKPTWVEFEKILSDKLGTPVVFENKWTGNGGVGDEFEYWKDRLNEVDIITGGSSVLSEYGEVGSLINLADYYDKLPNFKAFLEANPIVRLSITGNTKTGAVYFAPYFDGLDDIEKMPLMRVD